MAIVNQTEFTRPATVRIIYYNYDDDKALADATSVAISIINPDGTTVEVDEQAMNKVDTGTYEYYHETTSSDDEGDYQIEVIALDGSYKSLEHSHFDLSAGINE